jgi:glyoxylase-like metal-dependent hydrolase (beta-lactamase superfamily II)
MRSAGSKASKPKKLSAGLWRWTARHPDWHPGEFGSEVGSYAARVRGDELLLVDPLLPEDGDNAPGQRGDVDHVIALLDELAGASARVHVYITIPYHVRSTAQIVRRYGKRRVRVYGERRAARRLAPEVSVLEAEPGAELPFGGRCFAIGRPRRAELPLWIEDHAALVFGDALVEAGGELRIWSQDTLDKRRLAFYRERFVPTLAPLLELPVKRVLVTHGEPVLSGAAAELRRALERRPWYHRPG